MRPKRVRNPPCQILIAVLEVPRDFTQVPKVKKIRGMVEKQSN